ncbi:hypothetical protein JCM10450v2_005734 [Rhodotorula kratochvilovae]
MQSALLEQIQKGKGLKKTVTVDRSAPAIAGAVRDGPAPPRGGAPAVPRAPPVPGVGGTGESAAPAAHDDGPPQLAGIFAGVGMPTLRKTGAPVASSLASGGGAAPPRAPPAAPPRAPPAAPPPRPLVRRLRLRPVRLWHLLPGRQ